MPFTLGVHGVDRHVQHAARGQQQPSPSCKMRARVRPTDLRVKGK